jgi:hypothetical protein
MNFRTEVKSVPLNLNLKIDDSMAFLGSCFAQSMGARFLDLNLNVAANPLGKVYNPISLFDSINRALNPKPLCDEEILEHNELFHSWKHHGFCSNVDKETLIQRVFEREMQLGIHLQQSKVLFLTLGSAWAYRHNVTQNIVANCHKVKQQQFQKELVRAEKIEDDFKTIWENLSELNPDLKVVFTVSPVRYVRDGLVENNRSKAELLRAVHNLCTELDSCYYLPAYEWVIDDLRDYRFFDQDLVHPSPQAIDYVWDKMLPQIFGKSTQEQLISLQKLSKSVRHRPLNAQTEKHQEFIKKTQRVIEEMEGKTGLDLGSFKDTLKKQLQ